METCKKRSKERQMSLKAKFGKREYEIPPHALESADTFNVWRIEILTSIVIDLTERIEILEAAHPKLKGLGKLEVKH
jgi:hypothetical protein